ncbi:MAG: hypothetical protein Kow0042_27860 [Calditrichia bacterium]
MERIRTVLLSFLVICFPVMGLLAQYQWPYQEELRKDIDFWVDIFTRYNKNQAMIHDSEILSLQYKVITFDSTVSPSAREKHIQLTKDQIKASLLKLAEKAEKVQPLTPYEKYLLHLIGDTLNPAFLRELAGRIRAQQGMRDQFIEGIRRSFQYIPYIQKVFLEHQLPDELAYLPHIESSFNPRARSYVGAAGMWQFIRSTGRYYMKINRIVDQRYDPFVSTRAAARVLKHNYEQTGDWGLAMTAYNFGLSGIKRAIARHGVDYLKVRETFRHRKFRFASRNFYPEFLAVVQIMRQIDYYFPELNGMDSTRTIPVQLKKPVNLNQLADELNIPHTVFKKHNHFYKKPAWSQHTRIPAGYWVHIPAGYEWAHIESLKGNTVVEKSPSRQQGLADKGETPSPLDENRLQLKEIPDYSLLSDRFTQSLQRYKPFVGEEENPPRTPVLLTGEEVSASPVGENLSVKELQANLRRKLAVKGNSIEVFANETLGHYADWLKVPISRLMKMNGLYRSQRIYQGREVRLDFSRVSAEAFEEKRFRYHQQLLEAMFNNQKLLRVVEHKIDSGESVWHIAQNVYGITLDLIQYFNFEHNINKLYPGDVLRIPLFQ